MDQKNIKSKPDRSFGREKRVRKRSEYLEIQNLGDKFRSNHFLLAKVINKNVDNVASIENLKETAVDNKLVSSEKKAPFRFGITVSKKVDKRAVRRNLLRRRVREYLRQRLFQINAEGAIVVIALRGACELEYEVIAKELNFLLKKAELIQKTSTRQEN